MKLSRFASLIYAGLLAAFPAAADTSPDPHLTDAERQELVELLESSERELLELVDGVTGDDWSRKPAPDKWSVGDVVEHLMLSEGLLMETIEATLATEPRADWAAVSAGKEERIHGFMSDRSLKASAPGPLEPTGEPSREALLEGFAAARAKSLDFLRDTDKPLKQHLQPHPAEFFGELNAAQWVLFLGAHNQRHNQQIVEVKETLGLQ